MAGLCSPVWALMRLTLVEPSMQTWRPRPRPSWPAPPTQAARHCRHPPSHLLASCRPSARGVTPQLLPCCLPCRLLPLCCRLVACLPVPPLLLPSPPPRPPPCPPPLPSQQQPQQQLQHLPAARHRGASSSSSSRLRRHHLKHQLGRVSTLGADGQDEDVCM